MQDYELTLQSEPSNTFRCIKAAQSVDLDIKKKLTHHLKIKADIDSPFNVGLIVGASGSGKTTLTKQIFGQDCFDEILDLERPVIEQFPKEWTYEDCAKALTGAGLSSVVCWIRPAKTLSNGQKARAEIALQLSQDKEFILIDEFTSVVDRTIAKIMAHTVQKIARRQKRKIVLCSCHYDVIEWLNPCWIIDCNKQVFTCRRLLWQEYKREEKLKFEIKKCDRTAWKYFSKYHYLSENLAGGYTFHYGLFQGKEQIGYINFAEYVPWKDKKKKRILHANRIVIHPDYIGLGLGIKLTNELAAILSQEHIIMCKMSSLSIYHLMKRDNKWILKSSKYFQKEAKDNYNLKRLKGKKKTFRQKVKQWTFKYIGEKNA